MANLIKGGESRFIPRQTISYCARSRNYGRSWKQGDSCDMSKRALWDVTATELRTYFDQLSTEREHMSLPWTAVAASTVVVTVKEREAIVAAAGIRRVKGLPVAWFVVHRDHQGQGHGRQLNDALNKACRKAGYRFITLSVEPDNERAVKLYATSGYRTFLKRRGKTYMIKRL